ncbi:hypothetical protein NMY22_g2254 [Coprinellus aureogranulatus]|nr:hypothetical protein NMY22_g2254 [Coprinellus aureogranulatus]
MWLYPPTPCSQARDMLIDSWAPGAVLVCAPLNDPTPSTRLDLSHNPCVNKAGFAQIIAEHHLEGVNIDGCNISIQDIIDLLKTQPALFRGVEAVIHPAFLSLENLDPYNDASLGIPCACRLYYGGETFRIGGYGWVSLPFFGTDQLVQNLADFVDIHANHGLATLPNPANLRSIFGSSYRDGEKSWAARELQMIPVENECTSLVDGYSLFFIPHLRWRIFGGDVDPLKGFDYIRAGWPKPRNENAVEELVRKFKRIDLLRDFDGLVKRHDLKVEEASKTWLFTSPD